MSCTQLVTRICISLLASFVGLVGGICSVHAQSLLDQESQAFNRAVEIVSPSVVQIESFLQSETASGEVSTTGPTTGTIVGEDGWIVTSLFAFRGKPASTLVRLPDGRRVAAKVVARDNSRELVLLKIEVQGLPVPRFAELDSVHVGNWSIALGKTYDFATASRSVGIISALGRVYDKAVQTDAKVSPINYGGPLVDVTGAVIGILAPLSPGTFLEGDSSELYDSGIGFAIPMPDIAARLSRLKKGQDIHRGLLGVVVKDQNELVGPVVIAGATPGSPAAKAGVKAGDQVVHAGDRKVSIFADLKHALGNMDAGQRIEFRVRRGEEEMDLSCELVEEIPLYRKRYLGMHLRSDELAGVALQQVVWVDPNSPAAEAGIVVGDYIEAFDQIKLETMDDARDALSVAELDQLITLLVRSNGGESSVRKVELQPVEWPSKVPVTLPPAKEQVGESKCRVTELKLGDFGNKCFAIVPPIAAPAVKNVERGKNAKSDVGLMIVLPSPGELDGDKTLEYWNQFCAEFGWIVVVINSQDAKAWSREEIGLPRRVLGQMDSNYTLDPSRIVLAGFGVGGRLALASASELRRATGIATFGTDLSRVMLQRRNSPGQSVDFLFVGDQDQLQSAADALQRGGYGAAVLAAQAAGENDWQTVPGDPLKSWLEGLARF